MSHAQTAVLVLIGLAACRSDPPGTSPTDRLAVVIEHDSVSAVLQLLTEGVNPNIHTSRGLLPVNTAIEFDRIELLDELLASGANPTLRDVFGRQAFDFAIGLDDPTIADRLILNAVTAAGGGPRVMEWMRVARGENVPGAPEWHEVLSGELMSLGLMYLALHDNGGMVRQLRRGREIPNRTGYHALAVASRWGRRNAVRALLAIDVHPAQATDGPERLLPIDLAQLGGHDDIITLLKNAGARIPVRGEQ